MSRIDSGLDRRGHRVVSGMGVRICGDHPYRGYEGFFEEFDPIGWGWGARVLLPLGRRMADGKSVDHTVWVMSQREWELIKPGEEG